MCTRQLNFMSSLYSHSNLKNSCLLLFLIAIPNLLILLVQESSMATSSKKYYVVGSLDYSCIYMTESSDVVQKSESATLYGCFRLVSPHQQGIAHSAYGTTRFYRTRCTRAVVVSELMRIIHHNHPVHLESPPQNSNLAADGQDQGNKTTKHPNPVLVIHMTYVVPKTERAILYSCFRSSAGYVHVCRECMSTF